MCGNGGTQWVLCHCDKQVVVACLQSSRDKGLMQWILGRLRPFRIPSTHKAFPHFLHKVNIPSENLLYYFASSPSLGNSQHANISGLTQPKRIVLPEMDTGMD